MDNTNKNLTTPAEVALILKLAKLLTQEEMQVLEQILAKARQSSK